VPGWRGSDPGVGPVCPAGADRDRSGVGRRRRTLRTDPDGVEVKQVALQGSLGPARGGTVGKVGPARRSPGSMGRERRGVATEAVVIMAGPARMPCPISRPSWAVAVRWCSHAVRTAASSAPTPTPG
jgi:hypothetical protein